MYRKRPMYRFLLSLTIVSAVGLQAWRTLFNNFAVDIVHLSGTQIGVIQSFREIPGFLSLLAILFLVFLKEHHLSSLSVVVLGIGISATGFFPSFEGLLLTTLLMSIGFHYYEVTNQSLTLQFFDEHESPMVFSRQRRGIAVGNIAINAIIFCLIIFLSYKQIYLVIGAGVFICGLWALKFNPVDKKIEKQTKKMVVKKKYWLFYLLNILSGARRQIFVVFAVLLLVKKFNFSVQEISLLFIANNIINYFVAPIIGKGINKFGERSVLSVEYCTLIIVFIGYAFVQSKIIVAVFYIVDHILFNFAIAIRTYFQKIADNKDIASSAAVSFTINHVAAIVLPLIGGVLWMIDYRVPFLAGAIISFCSLVFVQVIPLTIRKVKGI